MDIIITIPEGKYKALQICRDTEMGISAVDKAILEGTVLPEGYGDLIERDAVEKYVVEYGEKHGCNWIDNSVFYKWLKGQPSTVKGKRG